MANELIWGDRLKTMTLRYKAAGAGRSKARWSLCIFAFLLGLISMGLLAFSFFIYTGNKKRNSTCVKSAAGTYDCKMIVMELWLERAAALALGLAVLLTIDWNCSGWCGGQVRNLAVFFLIVQVGAAGGAAYFFFKIFHADGINEPKKAPGTDTCFCAPVKTYQGGFSHILALICAAVSTLFGVCYSEAAVFSKQDIPKSSGPLLPLVHASSAGSEQLTSRERGMEGMQIAPRVGHHLDSPVESIYVDTPDNESLPVQVEGSTFSRPPSKSSKSVAV